MDARSLLQNTRLLDACLAAVLLGFVLLLWLPRFDGPIDLRNDAAVYYVLGSSLAEGKGYRLLNEPGEIEAIQYPPLLPALVAAHQWMLGTSDVEIVGRALRLTFFAIFALYVLAAYAMARQYLHPGHAWLVASIATFYTYSYFLSDTLYAEIPLALVSMLFVVTNRRGDQPGWVALTGLLGASAYLLRSAGVALLVAWVAEALLRKAWRPFAIRLAISLIPIAAWQGWVLHVTSSADYERVAYEHQRAAYMYNNVSYAENALLVDPFVPELGRASLAQLAERVRANLAAMPTSLGESVSANKGYWIWALGDAQRAAGVELVHTDVVAIPVVGLGLLVLAGTALMLRGPDRMAPLYLAGSIALICLTPWPIQFTRYLAPVTPFLALMLGVLLAALGQWSLRSPKRRWRVAAMLLVVVVGGGVLAVELFSVARTYRYLRSETMDGPGRPSGYAFFFYTPDWAAIDVSIGWIAENTEEDAIITTPAPHLTWVKAGRKAFLPPMELDPDRAQRSLDSAPVDYLVVGELDVRETLRRYIHPMLEKHADRWTLVHSVADSETRIFRRVPRTE